jgi:SH3-like domain-containing protein
VKSFTLLLFAACASAAHAAEFRSVSVPATVLYDGPSLKANRMYIANRQYPLEVISQFGGWVKVRDAGGEIAWVQAASVSDKRTVIVVAALAEVREHPEPNAPLVFRAEKNVMLELLEPPTDTWAKVRHRDGEQGFVRIEQIWGI